MVFPTEAGLVVASPEKWYGTEATRGYDYAGYKLSEYKLNRPEATGAFLHVSRINDSSTPRLVQAFYRSNFTMTRPWLTRLLNHLAFLPDTMPRDDEAHNKVTTWCKEHVEELEKWEQFDRDQEAAQRAAGDDAEETLRKSEELRVARVRNSKWRRARRRDARMQIAMAAEMMRLEEERKQKEAEQQRLAEEAAARKAAALKRVKEEQAAKRKGGRRR